MKDLGTIKLTKKDVELILDGLHELFMSLSKTPVETVEERTKVSNLHARFSELLKEPDEGSQGDGVSSPLQN